MRLILDARRLQLYPFAKPGFTGATEIYARRIASGLADLGHTVHVVCPDLDQDEQRGPSLFYWTNRAFPSKADAVIAVHDLNGIEDFNADALILASNGADPWCGKDGKLAELVTAFPVFSRVHGQLLHQLNPHVALERCVMTGLGVDINDYALDVIRKIPGQLLFANDPARGLWHVLDILELVQKEVPEATLAITYDFNRQFEFHRWRQNAMAEMLWECKRRIETVPGVLNLGAVDRKDLINEQLACQVHVMPSDPANVGTQIHGLTQMECAAAGAALVLSDVEAFPEVFGEAATILPVPGWYDPVSERRCDAGDYAEVVVRLMKDPVAWLEASRRARALAEQHTWATVIDRWDTMIEQLLGVEQAA